jgi:hypothetical protein
MARDIAQVAEHLPSRHKKKVNYIWWTGRKQKLETKK